VLIVVKRDRLMLTAWQAESKQGDTAQWLWLFVSLFWGIHTMGKTKHDASQKFNGGIKNWDQPINTMMAYFISLLPANVTF